MGTGSGRARLWSLVTLLVLLMATLLVPPEASAEDNLRGSFMGSAYSSQVSANLLAINAELGKTVYTPCPCNGTRGRVITNSLASVHAGNILNLGSARASVQAYKQPTSAYVSNVAEITGLNLLNGLITADAIKAVATTRADTTKVQSFWGASRLVNLRVNNRTLLSVQANTRIDLPGLGYVVLKEVRRSGNDRSYSTVSIAMIHVYVTTSNSLGLPVGAEIVVGYAKSGFTRREPTVIAGGQAYTALGKAAAGSTTGRLGKVALVSLGCLSAANKAYTNTTTGASIAGGILSTGVGTNTAEITTGTSSTSVTTTSEVADVSLLGGIIGLDGLKAVATASSANGTLSTSTAGTRFANLVVAGVPLPVNVAPNTRMELPLLGYVILNEQTRSVTSTGASVSVNMIHVYVTTRNTLGLPVGTEIIVGHANASIKPFTD